MSEFTSSSPPLLSLKIKRSVDDIIKMETNLNPLDQDQQLKNTKTLNDTILDYSSEIIRVKEIIEQQSFAFVALHNKIKDSRKKQEEALDQFHKRYSQIDEQVRHFRETVFQNVQKINHRIDVIEKIIIPKPIFRQILEQNTFGRITAINVNKDYLIFTTFLGYFVVADPDTLQIRFSYKPLQNESLFSPKFLERKRMIFALSHSGSLFLIHNFSNQPKKIMDKCFSFETSHSDNEIDLSEKRFDIATGHNRSICFWSITEDFQIDQINSITVKGIVSHILYDNQNNTLYAMTSKQYIYSISTSTFQIITWMQSRAMLLDIKLTTCFLIYSAAPNDIIIMQRNREKFTEIKRITINNGLRKFETGPKHLYVITKDQKIELRYLCNLDISFPICEPDAADYEISQFIGAISIYQEKLYLSHNNLITKWN